MKKTAIWVTVTLALAAGAGLWLTLRLPSHQPTGTSLDATRAKLARLEARQEERPEYPEQAAEHFALFRHTPHGESPAQLTFAAAREIRARDTLRRVRGVARLENLRIETVGPGNFGGRLRGIVIHPTNANLMLVGSVSGGIWKSTDGGASWAASDDFLPNLAVGSMLQDPDNANRVWVGSGEGFFNVDSMQGMGVFQSDDFGDTWTLLPSTNSSDFFYVNRIARVPGTNIILAATRTGIWRSNNLGTTWTETSGVATSSRGFTDLKVDPTNTNRMFAYHYGGGSGSRRMYRTVNSGTVWTELNAAQGLPTTDIGRMEIGIGSDGVVYASVGNAADQTRGLWRSPVGGQAFAKTTSTAPFIERQGWYDLPIGVDPADSNRVFVGAVDVYRTQDAGVTITKQSFWNPGAGQIPQHVHADIHVVAFDPSNPANVFIGSDGGIFKSTDSGTTWTTLDNDLRVTQYYGIAAHPNGQQVIGGTQDNGSHLFFGDRSTWLQWFGGDGGFSAWDQQQTRFIYGATPFAGLFGSGDGGASSQTLTLPSTSGSLFITPFTIDANDGNRMIVGTGSVLLSSNLRQLASATFTDVGPVGAGGSVSATTISPLDGTIAFVGKSNGDLWQTTGLGSGGGWTQIDTLAMPNTAVTWIEVDRSDASGNTLYATFSGFGTDRVWRSLDGGATWESIHGDLPDIPMFVVSSVGGPLYLGSELGLWVTKSNTNGTPAAAFTWLHYDYGVAFSRVMQLVWASERQPNDVLWIATHGRSIYRATTSPIEITIGDITTAGCGAEADFSLDAGEVASIPVTLTNRGGSTLTSLFASLSTLHPGVGVIGPPQTFADLVPGASDTQVFQAQLTATAACLDTAMMTVDVSEAFDTQTASFDLQLAADPVNGTGTLVEDGEDATTLYTSSAAVGVDDWGPVTDQANTGIGSWFAADVPSYADKSLFSPWLDIGAGTTAISFALRYDMEGDATQFWDGVVLEARTRGGAWVDIGQLSTVPYDGMLFNNNTIPTREAWSGTQTTWRSATVDLGTSFNGQEMQFRFRMVCDTGAANVGFWVDDISVTNATWLEGLVCDAGCGGPIFADGFESGDTSAWSATSP